MDIAEIQRHPERAVPGDVPAFLAAGHVAHIGFVEDGLPVIIPVTYHYDPQTPDRLFTHGAKASRLAQVMVSGEPLCIAVTEVDGLVYSRTAKNHSINYRSVVCFGRGSAIEDDARKAAMFESMTARYFPGREMGHDYAPPEPGQLHGTQVVEITITRWSAKTRTGGPMGPRDADDEALGTRGVIGL